MRDRAAAPTNRRGTLIAHVRHTASRLGHPSHHPYANSRCALANGRARAERATPNESLLQQVDLYADVRARPRPPGPRQPRTCLVVASFGGAQSRPGERGTRRRPGSRRVVSIRLWNHPGVAGQRAPTMTTPVRIARDRRRRRRPTRRGRTACRPRVRRPRPRRRRLDDGDRPEQRLVVGAHRSVGFVTAVVHPDPCRR